MKKLILSILLTLVMVIGMLPTVAHAASGTLTWGVESNGEPYVQWDADEFIDGEFLWVKVKKDGVQLLGTDGAFTMHNNTGGKLDLTEKIRNGGSGTYVVYITGNYTNKELVSASKAFSFDQSLSNPVLTYDESTLTLSWNDVGADYYELDVLQNNLHVFKNMKIAGTSIDLSEYTAAAGTYTFSLQAISEDFSCSSSKVKTISITKGSTLPALSGLKVSGLTAFWNAFDEANRYFIKVKKVGGYQVVGEYSSGTSFDLNRAVAHKWGGEGTYQIDVVAYKNSAQISNAASVNFDFEFEDLLVFDDQSPEMPTGETTTWLEYTVGESETFAFNHQYLNGNFASLGYGVEKYARLEGLLGDLMTHVEKTTDVTNGYPCGINHTFDKPGMYKLTETLRLKDKNGNTVATKTHVFNIEVAAKPPVTPTITQQPEDVANATGDVTLIAKADNATRARWYVEKSDGTVVALGDALTDGTSTQTISKASNAVGNRYFCAFWSEDDKIAKTDSVTVCFVPTVTSNGNVTVAAGNTAFLKVTGNGCGHYADANGWYKDGVKLTSGDKYYIMGTTLAVQNAAAADAGTYTYKYVTEHGDEVTADVTLTVNTGSSSTTIDTFDITGLDNPVILGTVADTSVSVPTGANYTVESVTWTAGVNGSGVVTGSSGMVSIKLKAKDGYTFKSGDLIGTVEGIYKTVYSVPANATEITVTVDYNNYSSWKIAYPANDTISISTDSLTFKVGTAANGQNVEGAFNCTHSGLADTNLHHTGMKYAVYSIADNAMPAGLTLNADGTITGTPTTAGVYTVMVRADSVNASGTASNCSGLAVKAIEIIVEDKDAHTHDTEVVSDTATCTTDGVMTLKCGCTVESPAKGHDWGEWNDGYPIITPPCTADSDLVITRTCANDASHTESKIISRIHMAMDWSTDDNYHWKVCVYCNNALVVEPEAHTDTNSDNKCDVCGVSYGEIPHHNYGTEKPEEPAEIGKTGLKAHYQCSECGKYFVDVDHDTHVEKKEVAYEDLIIPALVDNELTFEIPFSVVVKKTGDLDPTKETFTFKMFDLGYANTIYTVEGLTVETDGVNTYTGKLVIKVKESQFGNLSEGFKFAQVKGSADGWTYDETVYYIAPQISDNGDTSFIIFPGDSGWGNTILEKVEFTNSYNKAADNPPTGENSMMWLWVALMFVSGYGVVTTVLGKKRHFVR